MSLAIDVEKVTGVLLGGLWYEVEPGTFGLDSYEMAEFYENDGEWKSISHLVGGGADGVTETGFSFTVKGDPDGRICGPLTAITAVRETR